MPISFPCTCGKRLRVPDEHAGKRARCPDCDEVIRVPDVDHDTTLTNIAADRPASTSPVARRERERGALAPPACRP